MTAVCRYYGTALACVSCLPDIDNPCDRQRREQEIIAADEARAAALTEARHSGRQVVFSRMATATRVGDRVTLTGCFAGRTGIVDTAHVASDLRDAKCTIIILDAERPS